MSPIFHRLGRGHHQPWSGHARIRAAPSVQAMADPSAAPARRTGIEMIAPAPPATSPVPTRRTDRTPRTGAVLSASRTSPVSGGPMISHSASLEANPVNGNDIRSIPITTAPNDSGPNQSSRRYLVDGVLTTVSPARHTRPPRSPPRHPELLPHTSAFGATTGRQRSLEG